MENCRSSAAAYKLGLKLEIAKGEMEKYIKPRS